MPIHVYYGNSLQWAICVVQVLAFHVCINRTLHLLVFLKTLLTISKVANHSSSEAPESSEGRTKIKSFCNQFQPKGQFVAFREIKH